VKRVGLLGMPNCGKSTLFNRLTGASARIANWPGVTVDLMSARVLLGAHMVEVIDLPGIYDLDGFSDDEQVVREFLASQRIDALLIVVNTAQAERQLRLPLQAARLGIPMAVALNMADEARRWGYTVERAKLAAALGMPVCPVSAKYGQGMDEVRTMIARTLDSAAAPAIVATDRDLDRLQGEIAHAAVHAPIVLSETLTDRIDRVALHPWFGPLVFLAAMAAVFNAVFILGKPLQDGVTALFELARAALLEPAISGLPQWGRGFLLDGAYMGVTTVAAFLPLIVLFFFFMAFVEDSGYLSRAAFLVDSLMARLGLDGRSFVMLLMGFGCNVPALMGTRVMRSRPLRLLTMLVIPLSLCSARLQVFLFVIAALFAPAWAPWVLLALYVASIAAAILTAWIFRGKFASSEPFALELPVYRVPTWRHVAMRGWHEVHHFLRRATRFIVGGVVLVWFLTHYPTGAAPAGPDTLAGWIGAWMQPVLSPIGIDTQLALALLFGFVAKEVMIGAMAVTLGAEGDALKGALAQHLTLAQAGSFMLFTLLYTPCLSTVATLRAESRSLKFTLLAVAWPLALAWGASFAFYQVARALGG
jgi:ferrous iron transport protein B